LLDAPCGIQVAVRSTPANRRELLQTLEELRTKTCSRDPHCRCEVFEDLNQHNRFLWTEWWPAATGVQASIDSDGFRALMAAARVLGSLEYVHLLDTRESEVPGAPGTRSNHDTPRPLQQED